MKNLSFTQAALAGLKTTYALVDPQWHILEHDPQFSAWLADGPKNLVNLPLLDLLPEFVGQEDGLKSVQQGDEPFIRLDNVNRVTPEGAIRYLALTIVPGQPETGMALVLLVTDVTEQGEYLQELTQNRNELRIVRRRLAELSYQLDTLLRHYLSPKVADAFLKGELDLELGGDLYEVSILFADVRDFTLLSEQLSPDRIVRILNAYLNVVAQAVEEFDGTITQFQGDNLIAVFNMSDDQPDHALQAVKAAITLQRAVANYQTQQPPNEPRLHFGVGINTGTALIGNIGAHQRYSYTAVGDAVNLAARITSVAPANKIWLSQATYSQLKNAVVVEPLPPLTFKGKRQPTRLFQVQVPPS